MSKFRVVVDVCPMGSTQCSRLELDLNTRDEMFAPGEVIEDFIYEKVEEFAADPNSERFVKLGGVLTPEEYEEGLL